jgi:flagellar biosynthetic protein FliQ
MDISQAVFILRGGILETMLLSAPVLLSALVVGLIVSIIQATTSIQEQTLTFVPKIAVIFLLLLLLGGWMISSLKEYSVTLFSMISEMR